MRLYVDSLTFWFKHPTRLCCLLTDGPLWNSQPRFIGADCGTSGFTFLVYKVQSPSWQGNTENRDKALPGCCWLLMLSKLAFYNDCLTYAFNYMHVASWFHWNPQNHVALCISPLILSLLPKGLGRKKISPEKRQHISRNFNLWACDFIPSHFDGLSNNRTSYVHKETMVISTFRRFPRCYDEKWSAFKFVPNQSYTEFLKDQPNEEFSDDTKDVSPQEP